MSVETNEAALARGARALVETCGGVAPGEKVYVIANPITEDVARHVERAAREVQAAEVIVDVIDAGKIHGAPPPAHVGERMAAANVVFCLTSMSMAHTAERRRATDGGTRFLSLPDYSLRLLGADCLAADFRSFGALTTTLGEILDSGKTARITTPLGMDVTLGLEGRSANRCPGYVLEPGSLGSPPDAEVNIAPLEGSAKGHVVVDGSIPCREIGKLEAPISFSFVDGSIGDPIKGPPAVVEPLRALLAEPGPKSRMLGEFGIGLNPLAELTGVMLEDEGCLGTIHFGFGSNATIGGTNDVPFHLDFIIRRPTVWIDERQIMRDGELTLS